LVSSTNVAFTFSRLSRTETGHRVPLARGVIGASTILFLRILAATAVLNLALALAALRYFAIPFLLGALATLAGLSRKPESSEIPSQPANPLQFWASIQMVGLFQCVFYLMYWMQSMWGETGLFASGAILGLTDMDALTISMARGLPGIAPETAAQALSIGVLSNTALKALVALLIGKGQFRWFASGGLALIGTGLALSIYFLD
jgi:uncharacterized membrane protein (DUF4010 family)